MEDERFLEMATGDKPQNSSIIKVIGVGGGGGNAANYMYEQGIHGVNFVVCNTDTQDLQKSPIANKIQLGKKLTKGLGVGSMPEIGRQAAKESTDEIKAMLNPDTTEMVFIIAGFGGGTGTGATPFIAQTAKDAGILTVAAVTLPYVFEGERYNNALQGIKELIPYVDSFLVIKNDKIIELYPDLPIDEAEDKANELLCTDVRSISEIITRPGKHNVDFADVNSIMKNSGRAVMGTGRASINDYIKAAEDAVNSPLLDYKIDNAKGLLINVISGTKKLPAKQFGEMLTYITSQARKNVKMKYGTASDPSLGEDIAVTIVATGFETEEEKPQEAEKKEDVPAPVKKPPTTIKFEENPDDIGLYPPSYDDNEEIGALPVEVSAGNNKKRITDIKLPAVLRGAKKQAAKNDAASPFAMSSSNEFAESRASFFKNNPD